ncbi:MAG: ribbon-helix-helix protein, CopG family [Planctomycetota bacterium]|nr:ribbon-helix-helix protein, CopG family [Planctomycetota bacterium]
MPKKRKPGRPALGDEKLIKLSVQLSPDELNRVKKRAREEERSVAYVIRRAVRDMLDKKEK